MTPFRPSISGRHTATLIDNKSYILGGINLSGEMVKDFFYLDVSAPFSTQELLWQNLTNNNMVPPHHSATSAGGGANNDTLFLFGVNIFRKWGLTGVMDYSGKFYLWGGAYMDFVFSNEMLILDTINLNWKKGSLLNAPTPRHRYGATLLPNNKIIYIGGNNDNTTVHDIQTSNIVKGTALTLSEVYIYDMINDNWDIKITSGKIPSNRGGVSTILGLDGQKVIIYRGFFINPGYLDTTLYVLDLTNYNWYVPKISGIVPKPRDFYQANVIGKYMVISFEI
ncbi:hypothetical protein GLOIN_2v1488395 [Rhizophagus clarus]|uniref:Galactose oxidase n=1 Tax=Rhizophagus clarus TaxID=94130 RepID=A0A8H3LAT4_9GLOM|nr:hypothetical protein GLOIN_2v1488395 [Rhizophagus clarus]